MINVIWWDASRGNWDSGLLSEIFDKHKKFFTQYNTKDIVPGSKAIVIVVGKPEIYPLRQYLNTLESGLVILTSDEDSYFDWEAAVPSHLDIWSQYYAPNKKEITKEMCKHCGACLSQLLTGQALTDWRNYVTSQKKRFGSYMSEKWLNATERVK